MTAPRASYYRMEPSKNLEVDSVIDLPLPVAETVDEWHVLGSVARSGVGLLRGAEARGPGVAGAWCWRLPQGDAAGAGEHYVHVTGDGRVAECFEFQIESMAGSVVEASATLGYGYPGCTVAVPVSPPFSTQEPVFGVLPAAQSRLQDWTFGRFGPVEPLTTRRVVVNAWTAAVCTGDGRNPDNDDYDHHVNSGNACSGCWAGLPYVLWSSTVVGTGFRQPHASSCRVMALFSSQQSCGGLSGGVDQSKWLAH